jgi:hypothetical protein
MPGEADADLVLCRENGCAYQADMTPTAAYDESYFSKCQSYEGQAIADAINAGRVALVNHFIGMNRCCDIGIGSGEFIRHRGNTWGSDVNPVAIDWLRKAGRFADNLGEFAALTFWDVIEHVPTPDDYFRHVPLHGFVFTSVPIMQSLDTIRESKHYRPGEHLYYWTFTGFTSWMHCHGFMCVGHQTFEIEAGREAIHSFAFKRYRWPPHANA